METDLSDYLTLLKDVNHLNYQYLSTIIKKFKNVDRWWRGSKKTVYAIIRNRMDPNVNEK